MTSRPQKCPDSFFVVVFLFSRHSSSSFFFKRASSSLFFLSFSSFRLNASSNRPSSRIVSSTFFCRNSASPLPNRRTNADDCSLHLRCVSRAPSAKASSSSSLEGTTTGKRARIRRFFLVVQSFKVIFISRDDDDEKCARVDFDERGHSRISLRTPSPTTPSPNNATLFTATTDDSFQKRL